MAISYSSFISFDIKVSNSRITISIDDGTYKRRNKRIFKRDCSKSSISDEITECLNLYIKDYPYMNEYKITFTKFGKGYIGVIHK